MSDPVTIALIISAAPALLAYGSLRASRAAAAASQQNTTIGQQNAAKLTEIHTLTNSGMTEVREDLRKANARLATQGEEIGTLRETIAAVKTKKRSKR